MIVIINTQLLLYNYNYLLHIIVIMYSWRTKSLGAAPNVHNYNNVVIITKYVKILTTMWK